MPLTPFDEPDPLNMCRRFMHRIKCLHLNEETLLAWRWDLVDCIAISRQSLRDSVPKLDKLWQEVANELEQKGPQIPSVLRQTLEDVKRQKEPWVANLIGDFDSAWELADGLTDRLLYEQTAGWFGGRPSCSEVLRLLEYLETLLDKVLRMNQQLELVLKSLSQTMIGSSYATQTFKERSMQDNLTSTMVSFAAMLLMPVPGIVEAWAISTGYMWLSDDSSAAGRHMVVEHGVDVDVNEVLAQFETASSAPNLATTAQWQDGTRKCAFLIHNASPRRVEVKLVAKCTVDKSNVRQALEAHPISAFAKKFANWGGPDCPSVIVPAREMHVVELPELLDLNWYHEVTFKHVTGSTLGCCCVKPDAMFSLVAVDVGVRVESESDSTGEIRVVNSSIAPCTVKVYAAGCNRVFSKAKFDMQLKVSESATYKLPAAELDALLELDVSLPRHQVTVDVCAGQTVRVDGVCDLSG